MKVRSDNDVRLQWGVRIPLRDGIQLNAILYTPRAQAAPTPAIVTMTPYMADTYHERGLYFAAQGFPFLSCDVRGRGSSEGTFRPSIQEANDAHDVIEWIARQPFCNGKVAMWGGSYAGYCQWAAAKELPAHLATIVPAAAPFRSVDSPMRNNIFFTERMQWLTFTSGRAAQTRIYSDAAFWASNYRRWHESGRPFRELDAMCGNPSPAFQEWLDHPEPDAYWDAQNPTPEQYARIDIPVLTITGVYDDDQPGALEHFRRHIRYASPAGRARHFLLLGPWDHAGTRTPIAQFGGLTLGPQALLDLNDLHLQWYRWAMQGGTRPTFLQKSVAYYLIGADAWRYADTLEAVTANYRSLFLDSAVNATDIFCSGSLGERPGCGPPDWYTHDPRRVDGPEVEAEALSDAGSLVDQSVPLAMRGQHLVYHSEPFAEDTDIAGFFRLSAWIAIDCPDTDLYACLYEVRADGSTLRLTSDALRARYREGPRSPRLIDTRDPLRYEFERFPFTACRVRRGHRLRLIIGPSGRLIQAHFAQKNYNAGGIVAEESAEHARTVTVRLFHDPAHPSALHVPLAQPDACEAQP